MNCPHCNNKRVRHADGALHCNACGCCFIGDEQKPGHPMCNASALKASEEYAANLAKAVEESQKAEEEATPDLEVVAEEDAPKPRKKAN
jgi:hypothetical protein